MNGLGKYRLLLLAIAAIIVFVACSCGEEKRDPFHAGTAIAEITPPTGYPGYRGISTGVQTPLYAKALVFRQGNIRAAILVCDLLSIPRDLSRIVREQASDATGISFQHISISATHTHTGPDIRTAVEDYADREASGTLSAEDREGYIHVLIQSMVRALAEADRNLKRIEMVAGTGKAEGISFNRRFLMTSGKVRFNPSYMDPEMLHPVGPVDPDVHFLMIRPEGSEEYSASLTVFANHLDTHGGTEFHADYPWYLERGLKEVFGEQLISLFGTGTCGNLNHCDRTAPRPDGKLTESIGRTLADKVSTAVPSGRKLHPNLRVASRVLYLPLQDYTEQEYAWAMDPDAGPLYPEREFLTRVRKNKIRSLERLRRREAVPPVVTGDPWRLPVEIQVIGLDNNTAIVAMPGEIFVELGLELKRQSPFANTMVIELANSDILYVPTKEAFSEGGYEALNSRLAPGSGEKMIKEALSMLVGMQSE